MSLREMLGINNTVKTHLGLSQIELLYFRT